MGKLLKKYTLSDEEYQAILDINKEGGDPVMYMSGGEPMGRSLTEKINSYWEGLAKTHGFKSSTVKGVHGKPREFLATPV